MTIETIDLVDTLAGNSSYFLIFDFLMLLSIHPELHRKFLVPFGSENLAILTRI